MSLTTGVAGSGIVAVLVSLSGNVITDTIKAGIVNEGVIRSQVDAGALSISASDTSTVDALAFGVAGTGIVAVGVGLSANVITSTIHADISDLYRHHTFDA